MAKRDEQLLCASPFALYFGRKDNRSLREYLDTSNCDEMAEFNVNTDSYQHIFHVLGKYAIAETNETYSAIFNYARLHVVHPEDLEDYDRLMDPAHLKERMAASPMPNFLVGRFRYKLSDGSWRYVEQCLIGGKENGLDEGVYRFYVFDIQNIVNRQFKAEENHVAKNDYARDELTGLAIEKVFFTTGQVYADMNKDTPWCLVVLDIEHFKLFDEWYGRRVGDMLLAKIGSTLAEITADNGFAGYLGQDDFCFLLKDDPKLVIEVYDKLTEVIHGFGASVGFIPSFGVCQLKNNLPLVDAFDRASIAMAQAKSDPKKHIRYYQPGMHAQNDREYRVITEFMDALKENQVTFYLQPQVRISSRRIVGAEALARWIRPDGKIVPPNEFVPVLEKYGFITDMDKYLWERVFEFQRDRLAEGKTTLPISLNVSQVDLFSVDVPAYMSGLLKKYEIPANVIKIEITESAYAESATLVREVVERLRKLGFLVFMDDFGSGYSSLNMLGSLNVDVIKLDAFFLNVSETDHIKGVHILESIVSMAKNLALPIIVEGVETQIQTDFLEGLGCRYAQGYHFYRPMPIAKYIELVDSKDMVDDRGFVAKANEQFRIREFMDENVYSDSMLNNLIGPVAFYETHDSDVDIVRFNEQFYKSVNVPDFADRLRAIQQFLPPEDQPKLYEVLDEAEKNRLNGAKAILRFYKTDGTLSSYFMHFYFLAATERGKRFYGSATDLTEFVDLQNQLAIVSRFSKDARFFLRRKSGNHSFEIASYGMESILGLTSVQFRTELMDRSFKKRIGNTEVLSKLCAEAEKANSGFITDMEYIKDDGTKLILKLRVEPILDQTSNFAYYIRISQKNSNNPAKSR